MKHSVIYHLMVMLLIGSFGKITSLQAQNRDEVSVHGFSSWAYGKTNRNSYFFGNEDGDYRNVTTSTVIIARPYPNLRISTSVEFREGSIGDVKSLVDRKEFEVEVDFCFAEWKVSDAFKFRAGRVKHPFGIYGELLDVGTVRPLLSLSAGVYGPGMSAEAYDGLGLTGGFYGKYWGMEYDLYGGGLELGENAEPVVPKKMNITEAEAEEDDKVLQDMLGGRLTLNTPLSGLILGAAGFSGTLPADTTNEEGMRSTSVGGYSEYSTDDWVIRSEFARLFNDEATVNAFYIESSLFLNDHWQIAGRYDVADEHFKDPVERSKIPKSRLEHQDITLGINYWFTLNLVLKFAVHDVEGLMFVQYPENADKVKTNTRMYAFGAQFSF